MNHENLEETSPSTRNAQHPIKQELIGKITQHTVESEIRPDGGLIWRQLDESFFVIPTGEEESLVFDSLASLASNDPEASGDSARHDKIPNASRHGTAVTERQFPAALLLKFESL